MLQRRLSLVQAVTVMHERDSPLHESVPISYPAATPLFSQMGSLVNAVVAWTVDGEPQTVGDIYTVCSTLALVDGTPVGPQRCQLFGPF